MNAMIILADLGRMKAYSLTRDDLDPNAAATFGDLVDIDLANQHSKVSERATDKAGRFQHGPGNNSVGERHNEQQEAENQQLRSMAQTINATATANGHASDIYFAAPKEIVSDLLECLDPKVRKRIRTTLPLNLVKTPKLELLERFGMR